MTRKTLHFRGESDAFGTTVFLCPEISETFATVVKGLAARDFAKAGLKRGRALTALWSAAQAAGAGHNVPFRLTVGDGLTRVELRGTTPRRQTLIVRSSQVPAHDGFSAVRSRRSPAPQH